MEEEQFDQALATPRLNRLNWLNLGSYVLNFVITYGVGTLGWLGNGNNAQLSEEYQVCVNRRHTHDNAPCIQIDC